MEILEANCYFCFNYDHNRQINTMENVSSSVRSIIEKHFWFTSNELIELHICSVCQDKLSDFYDFYCQVEKVYKQRLKKYTTKKESTNESSDEIDVKILVDALDIKLYSDHTEGGVAIQKEDIDASPETEIKSEDLYSDPSNESDTTKRVVDVSSGPKITSKLVNGTTTQKRKKLAVDEEILLYCNLNCHVCSENFKTFNGLMRHCKKTHNQQGHVICCDQRFFRASRLLNHIQVHTNPDAFQCSECKKNFPSNISLRNHYINVHLPVDERKFACDICLKKFAKRNSLNAHKLIHNTEEEFVCEICSKKFPKKSSLRTHIKSIHERSTDFMCDICSKQLKSKYALKAHLAEHVDNERVPCTVCGQFMKNQNSLRKHMKGHTETSLTITCDICGKRSPTTGALKKHIRDQHKIQPTHQCTMCDKSFKRSIALKEHMSTHTGEMLYSCEFCDRKFNSSANLSSHRKKVHPQEWQEYQQM
ncbi:gastrula zinc finger protein XlCGF26.1-like isoform X2 [Uranotaenia lowii]|uniref:gastrula zinc finger protein XlCGF26.1-like isoform X2 n=1 Tax=Uranotaenia lowii TaxID=190385 RepID=UPI00247924A9|nr:gastrula zinc finger protein XlCGF26.1-like isoform X2 [Uranotaenia lowii]